MTERGSDAEGLDAEGLDAEGSDAEGSDAEGSDAEGSDAEGSDAEGSDAEGAHAHPLLGRVVGARAAEGARGQVGRLTPGPWLASLMAHAVALTVVAVGLLGPLDDRLASFAFASLPEPATASGVVLLTCTPPSGSRYFADAALLDAALSRRPPDSVVVVHESLERFAGRTAAPPEWFKDSGDEPVAGSDELVRDIPERLPDHVVRALAALRSAPGVPPRPWWGQWPLAAARPLLDASLVPRLETFSMAEVAGDGARAAVPGGGLTVRSVARGALDGARAVVVGDDDFTNGPQTYQGKTSEPRLIASILAAATNGREVFRPGALVRLVLCALLALAVSYVVGGVRPRVGAALGPVAGRLSGAVLGAAFAGAAILGATWALERAPLWADPAPLALLALVAGVWPLALPARSSSAETTEERRRRDALEAVRAAYEAPERKGFEEALAEVVAAEPAAGSLWKAIVEQESLGDRSSVEVGSLPLHAGEVEELYLLGKALQAGYHWQEALAAYDWAALRRLGYLDLADRRREVKDAVLGNLEFVDVAELVSSIDKRYGSLELIGQGGMGVVLKGWDAYLERPVALKLIQPSYLADPVSRERFVREVELLGRLNHPNVVQIFTVHQDPSLFYYTMELLKGKDLRAAVGEGAGAPLVDRLEACRVLAETLDYLSGQGVVHRDLKPDNAVLVAGRGPVLIDFGVARGAEQREGLTMAGQMVGTLAYMAPELVQGGCADLSTDVFAFGVILYELFTGRLPFSNPLTIKANPPKAPSAVKPGIEPDVEALIVECMALDRGRRPPGFGPIAQRLRAVARGLGFEPGARGLGPGTATGQGGAATGQGGAATGPGGAATGPGGAGPRPGADGPVTRRG